MTSYNSLRDEVLALNHEIVDQQPANFAKLLDVFVKNGSALHVVQTGSLEVYANPDWEFEGKETEKVKKVSLDDNVDNDLEVADTLAGLLAAGTKFFDALFYLLLPDEKRPKPKTHPKSTRKDGTNSIAQWNNMEKITKFIFTMYFFILIRGHAPTDGNEYRNQPMPKFISSVLGIKDSVAVIQDYLASFPLGNINPAWVKSIKIKDLSQEAASRLALGVAGYRQCSVFNSVEPDLYYSGKPKPGKKGKEDDQKDANEKPEWLDGAVTVAKSFLAAGLCWDFHPATRNPNVLTKYGNINNNCSNLILECYTPRTLERLKGQKKLYSIPTYMDDHTNYKQWTTDKIYVATSPIFPSN